MKSRIAPLAVMLFLVGTAQAPSPSITPQGTDGRRPRQVSSQEAYLGLGNLYHRDGMNEEAEEIYSQYRKVRQQTRSHK